LSEGTRIQMGAFKFEHEAQGLLEKLQQQGIYASIYRP
ncbi:MAG: SPOR domain-containing protein, partial [Moorea sp. SIO2I5]|nr:SPOR domain-containing protein [Moorena sp. SIO2I5]